jgi:hypothetical protein
MEKMDREIQQDQEPPMAQSAVPGSDEWWAARLAAVAGGRASSQESDDWLGSYGSGSTSTSSTDETDDVCGDLTDDLASSG